jgi:hypothetical protein
MPFVALAIAILFIANGMAGAIPVAQAVATFSVTNTADSGAGSLRQAILNANAAANSGGPDIITFTIPGADPNCAGGVCTITS